MQPVLHALDEQGTDSGATAWLLVSAALVLLMTPGIAFFYGGMVRRKNVLGVVMQSFAGMAVVSLLWIAVGFSLAFAGSGRFIGDLRYAGLPSELDNPIVPGVPLTAFALFQMMFAVVTAALITGAAPAAGGGVRRERAHPDRPRPVQPHRPAGPVGVAPPCRTTPRRQPAPPR